MKTNYTLPQAIAKRIKELLYSTKITQYRLTKTTCLSEKTIRDILHERTSDVKISTLYLIANAFGLSLNEFFDSSIFDEKNILI